MVFVVNALLILIEPPFKAVPFAFFDVARLCQENPFVAPSLLAAPVPLERLFVRVLLESAPPGCDAANGYGFVVA